MEDCATLAVCWKDPRSYVNSPIVKIRVGEGQKLYLVHKALLVQYCPYFKACLKPGFSEGINLEVDLKEADTYAFDAFISWIYNGHLWNLEFINEEGCDNTITIYQLAHQFSMTEFMNLVLDKLRCVLRRLHLTALPSHIIRIHDMGLLDTQLGRMCLRSLAWSINQKPSVWITECDGISMSQCPEMDALYERQDVAVEVMKYMIKQRHERWHNPAFEDNCDYHDHPGPDAIRCPLSHPVTSAEGTVVANRRRSPGEDVQSLDPVDHANITGWTSPPWGFASQ